MKQPHIVNKDEIMRFNKLRQEQIAIVYNQEDFKRILKNLNLPINGTFQKCLIETKVFIRVERGKYSFPPEPVHMSLLQKAYDTCASYKKQFRNKDKQTQEQEPQQLEVQQAIDLLKNLGYRVLRPTTQYEEV